MSTLAEIEEAVEALPVPEQEVLLRHLSARLRPAVARGGLVPPPEVPTEGMVCEGGAEVMSCLGVRS